MEKLKPRDMKHTRWFPQVPPWPGDMWHRRLLTQRSYDHSLGVSDTASSPHINNPLTVTRQIARR